MTSHLFLRYLLALLLKELGVLLNWQSLNHTVCHRFRLDDFLSHFWTLWSSYSSSENKEPTLLVQCLYQMSALNHKKSHKLFSATNFLCNKHNWQLKDRRFPIGSSLKPNNHSHVVHARHIKNHSVSILKIIVSFIAYFKCFIKQKNDFFCRQESTAGGERRSRVCCRRLCSHRGWRGGWNALDLVRFQVHFWGNNHKSYSLSLIHVSIFVSSDIGRISKMTYIDD